MKKVYAYKHKQFICENISPSAAAHASNLSYLTVWKVLNGKIPCTRNGWYFSYHKLSDEELEKIEDREVKETNLKRIDGRSCRKVVQTQEYQVDCKDGHVGFIPKTFEGKKALLRKYIFKIARDRWLLLPKQVAILERTLIMELIDSLTTRYKAAEKEKTEIENNF